MPANAHPRTKLLLGALALTVLSACDAGGGGSCNVESDQQGSFMAKVSGFPIPISVDTSFSAAQMQAIQTAAQEWNAVGQQLAGTDFFSVSNGENYETNAPDISSCGQNVGGGDSTLLIVNEPSQSDWTSLQQNHSVSTASAVGVTFRCVLGSTAQRQITALDTSQIQPSQFSSVVLHELGHGLGLDHSCSSSGGSSSFVSCQGLPSSHPYVLAVMYPSLQMPSTGNAFVQVKDHIQSNDIDRTQCLYGN